MPRARSSGALSIWSYALNSPPCFSAITFVNAAVSVVLPWSTCPIVPTFTCGLLRSNFALAILALLHVSFVSVITIRRIARATSSRSVDAAPRCRLLSRQGERDGGGRRAHPTEHQ